MDFRSAPSLFQPYLLLGERILWTGKPKQGVVFRSADALLIPFSLLWGGFAIFWNVGVWTLADTGSGTDLPFKLFGLPFLIIGLYIMIGRFFHDAAMRRSVVYAVTDQRILVLRGARSQKFTSFDLRALPKLELSECRDGSGTIALEPAGSFFDYGRFSGMDWWVPSLGISSQLFRINDPRSVYQLIRDNSVGA